MIIFYTLLEPSELLPDLNNRILTNSHFIEAYLSASSSKNIESANKHIRSYFHNLPSFENKTEVKPFQKLNKI